MKSSEATFYMVASGGSTPPPLPPPHPPHSCLRLHKEVLHGSQYPYDTSQTKHQKI